MMFASRRRSYVDVSLAEVAGQQRWVRRLARGNSVIACPIDGEAITPTRDLDATRTR
jgi:hypothetical protein